MPIYKPKIPVMAAIACSGVALIFQLVAVAGIGWIISGDIKLGLFRYCNSYGCYIYADDIDVSVSDVSAYWRVCQAFSLLGEATIFGSFAIGVLHMFREDTERLTVPAVVLNVVSAVFLTIEIGVFAGKTSPYLGISFFGYGFYVSILAAVLSVVSAILHAVGRFVLR